jgi:hypothetical protein
MAKNRRGNKPMDDESARDRVLFGRKQVQLESGKREKS